MIVIKNGYLVAEEYFNGSDINHQTLMASVSKSYISSLIGLALEQGCLESLDQKMIEFFPEYADQITDPQERNHHHPPSAADALRISLGRDPPGSDGRYVGRG